MKSAVITLVVCLLICTPVYSYKKYTHIKITQNAVSKSSFSEYLADRLGFTLSDDFSYDVFPKKTIAEWFEEGSFKEDNAPNWVNHFYDFISHSGLKGFGSSSLSWGKDGLVNTWSWTSARHYFYTALTTMDDFEREKNYAMTFRSVAQVMHLVEDLAVPAHVRNDMHIPIPSWLSQTDLYEKHTEESAKYLTFTVYPAIDSSTFNDLDKFWTNDGKGLSEFTGSNFLSRDTNFDSTDYNLPAKPSTTVILTENVTDIHGVPHTVEVAYSSGNIVDAYRGTAEPIQRLSAYSLFNYETQKLDASKKVYTLNDSVHQEYANFLLPRAAGYAAGLLDYFFRGKIKLSLANPSDITFQSIKITAQNDTSGEDMGLGEVSLVIRYKALEETSLGGGKYKLNNPPEGTNIADYTYKVIKLSDKVDLKDAKELTFDLSKESLPLFFNDMSMQIVYKGPLGNESESVAVSPLTPIEGVYTNTVSLPSSGVYAKVSGDSLSGSFDELRLTAITDIPGGLSGGSFALVVEHSVATSDPYQSAPVDVEPADAAAYLIKAPIKNGVNSLVQNVPAELVFDLSGSPLPVKATDVYINVIYVTASGASLVVGTNDISEPTPVDVFNNCDKVCINHQWYNAGSPEAIAAAAGQDDAYAYNVQKIFVKDSSLAAPSLASSTNYTFSSPQLLYGGNLRRLGFILTDYSFKYSFDEQAVETDIDDPWLRSWENVYFNGEAVKNQTDPDGASYYPVMYNMRGNLMWGTAGTVYSNDWDEDTQCGWNNL